MSAKDLRDAARVVNNPAITNAETIKRLNKIADRASLTEEERFEVLQPLGELEALIVPEFEPID